MQTGGFWSIVFVQIVRFFSTYGLKRYPSSFVATVTINIIAAISSTMNYCRYGGICVDSFG